ncbi:MAG: hypothetical protein MRY79_07245, partial [Alphaproteobacteria bacterium]|nr:hypothetical protein [Alphaproteobacteria bacterium]
MNKNKTLFLSAVVMLAVLIVSGLGIFLMKDLTSFQSSENLSSLTLINSKNERFDIEVELAIQPDEVAKG